MKPTVRIGRIFGIEVGVHWSVLIIAGLLAVGLAGGERDVAVWAVAIVAVGLFFASLLAHELAHSVVARRNGMQVTGITLWLLGGMAQLGGPMPSARAELKVAAAGPATSVLLGIGFLLAAIAGAASGLLSSLPVSALAWLAFVNVVLAVFNLIPAAPLDGGRILAGFLWARHGDRPAPRSPRPAPGRSWAGCSSGSASSASSSTSRSCRSGPRCWAGSSSPPRPPSSVTPASPPASASGGCATS
jgi:Zn-dependent protease